MRIFMPKEIKCGEGRFSSIPSHVFEYMRAGGAQENGTICIEKGAGEKSGFPDRMFENHEAWIVDRPRDKEEFFSLMRPDRHHFGQLAVLKVKELLPEEYHFIQFHLPVISFGHLASNRQLTEIVIEREGTHLSLEDIVENGKRPILAGMSEIAGEEAVRIGIKYLSDKKPGVIIVGYGNVGRNAHQSAIKDFQLPVIALDINDRINVDEPLKKQHEIFKKFGALLPYSKEDFDKIFRMVIKIMACENGANEPALFILTPYIPEQSAPKIITNEMLKLIPPSSVIVDVSIDQGGTCEFSQVTTHENPYVELERGIKYIGIANLPGAVPQRSTPIFSESVFPYIMQIVKLGFIGALKENPVLRNAVSIYNGKITSEGLAKTFSLKYTPINSLL